MQVPERVQAADPEAVEVQQAEPAQEAPQVTEAERAEPAQVAVIQAAAQEPEQVQAQPEAEVEQDLQHVLAAVTSLSLNKMLFLSNSILFLLISIPKFINLPFLFVYQMFSNLK